MSTRANVNLNGFTLVEVVAALGAFAIAFLAGFAAIGALMIRQDINYRATVAASAATIFLKKDGSKGFDAAYAVDYLTSYAIPAGTRFRGYPVSETSPSGAIYTFKTGTINNVSLGEYRSVLVTNPAGKLMFWYGAPEEIEAARAATLDYLGSYAY
jgi:prepilin-type N-terminal cleavage/methylation domain-containing protein